MKTLLPISILLGIAIFVPTNSIAQTQAQVPRFKTKQQDNYLEINFNAHEVARYQVSEKLPKPFLLPVRTPLGVVITRPLNDEKDKDHPHHKGIWVAVDEVNDVDFWAEKGKIVNKSIQVQPNKGESAKFKVWNDWQTLDGQSVVSELTLITLSHLNNQYLLSYEIEFVADKHDVTFGDTKEGLFAFRMAASMKEKETGKVVNAEGKKGTAACWGQPSKWIDYTGTVDGKTVGLAIFDHPKNLRPSRYHVRNYGLFSISPCGERAYSKGNNPAKPIEIKKGESLKLRYAMYIHDGDTKSAKVAEAYEKWLEQTK